jgi:hypothetical protein
MDIDLNQRAAELDKKFQNHERSSSRRSDVSTLIVYLDVLYGYSFLVPAGTSDERIKQANAAGECHHEDVLPELLGIQIYRSL